MNDAVPSVLGSVSRRKNEAYLVVALTPAPGRRLTSIAKELRSCYPFVDGGLQDLVQSKQGKEPS
jgi:hypothetical protein